MRIFCAVRHSNDPKRFYGSLWSGNFYPALRGMGHELVESRVDLATTSEFMTIAKDFTSEQLNIRAKTTQKILDEVKKAHAEKPIDLFLSYFYISHFDPAAFAQIHAWGIPTVNFYCNSIYQFELVADIAATVNYAWHAEKHARSLYKAVGANPVWVQMAADPQVYRPFDGATRLPNAAFVGLRYADRDRWMAALVRANVPVEIYGPGWGNDPQPEVTSVNTSASPSTSHAKNDLAEIRRNFSKHGLVGGLARTWRQYNYRQQTRRLFPLFQPMAKGPVPFTRICEVFSSHEVILNFSNVWSDGRPGSNLIPHVRLRDFEAPMCRTCFLTGYTDEITEFYAVGKEIDTYNNPEELVDKVRFYLSHAQAAEQLREKGYQRARRDHTWVRRFEQLFREIGMA
jgi:spore maturation protein CgeB